MSSAPQPGTVMLGKYRIEHVLGEGGMGVVARAHHLQLDEPVAIKFLLPQVLSNQEVVQRFLREAQAAVKLKSEHVARVIDVGTLDNGAPYMVMEYLEGGDLGAMLKHYGPLQPAVAADLMLQACEALAEAHAVGIIHRDIKPSNLFVTRRRDGMMLLKVLDFGISKAPVGVDTGGLTRTQAVLGTPAYMSPEQMRATRTVDARADIWSLGVVLFELLGGRRPFESEAFSELCLKVAMDPLPPLVGALPAGLERVVSACLEKDPMRRTQTVAELAAALAPFASDPAQARVSADRCARLIGARPTERAQSHAMATVMAPTTGTGLSSVTGAASEVIAPSPRRTPWALIGGGIAAVAALVVVVVIVTAGGKGSSPPAKVDEPTTTPSKAVAEPAAVAPPAPAPVPEPAVAPAPTPVAVPDAGVVVEAAAEEPAVDAGTKADKKARRHHRKGSGSGKGGGDDLFDSRE
jgi:serine/threonine-protein kinase